MSIFSKAVRSASYLPLSRHRAFLSQASHLGSLLLPHDAFQEHAAHRTEWSAQLSSKGSERTCIRSGLPTFLHCACTAHPDFVVDGAPQRVRTAHAVMSR